MKRVVFMGLVYLTIISGCVFGCWRETHWCEDHPTTSWCHK
jgi:hypothetical protein